MESLDYRHVVVDEGLEDSTGLVLFSLYRSIMARVRVEVEHLGLR